MKGAAQPTGAGPAATETSLDDKPVIAPEKFSGKKKPKILRNFTKADVDREVRALEGLLKEEGLIGVPERELAREAAFEDLVREELCEEQIGKLARESARKTGDTIGEVVDRYERIVIELRCVRERSDGGGRQSLESVLRGAADDELKEFLSNLERWIRKYVFAWIRGERDRFDLNWEGPRVSEDLMTALGMEWVRDRSGLMGFLEEVFKHWREIGRDDSRWRVRLVTQQFACGVPHHRIVQRLEKIGAFPKGSAADPTTKGYASLRSRIKQYRSRDQKASLLRKKGKKALAKKTVTKTAPAHA